MRGRFGVDVGATWLRSFGGLTWGRVVSDFGSIWGCSGVDLASWTLPSRGPREADAARRRCGRRFPPPQRTRPAAPWRPPSRSCAPRCSTPSPTSRARPRSAGAAAPRAPRGGAASPLRRAARRRCRSRSRGWTGSGGGARRRPTAGGPRRSRGRGRAPKIAPRIPTPPGLQHHGDSRSTPRRSRTPDPRSTRDRRRIDLASAPTRPYTDLKSTAIGPQLDPRSTRRDPTLTPTRHEMDPSATQLYPSSTPHRPRLDRQSTPR